jgi:predicted MFS family arabinose efflux permease
MGMLASIFPLFLRDRLGFSESRVGLLLLVRAFFSTAGFWSLGRSSFWHFRPLPMILGQAGLAVLTLSLAFARMAINEAARTVGFVVGASGGGLLLQHASFSRVLVITATAILAATAVQVLLAYRPPVRSSW